MSFIDYAFIYSYYTNTNNFFLNNIPIHAWYYKFDQKHNSIKKSERVSGSYFEFDNKNIYVKEHNGELLFTILRPVNEGKFKNVWWSDHFHIGNDIIHGIGKNKGNSIDTIFLHYSYQDILEKKKDMIQKCNFVNQSESYTNLASARCTNRNSTIGQTFTPENLKIVEHIFSRPYVGPHIGGKKYGEGVYGVTYDFACKLNDNETLCKMLKERRVASIELHSFDNSIELSKQKEIVHFIRYMHNLDCCVAKVFKSYMIGLDRVGFTEELEGMKTIYKIFGDGTERETTLTSMKLYGFNFVAVYIVFVDGSHVYVTFSRKCESTLEKTPMDGPMLDRFLRNMLGTIEKMQAHGFAHCDIKPDNIIYCSRIRRFKLIDWGLSKYLKEGARLGGNKMFVSPLAHYVSGYPAFLAVRLMYYVTWKREPEWFDSKIFKELYEMIYDEFYEVLEEGGGYVKKYGNKFDVFSIGMCTAWVVWKHGLDWKKYKRIVMGMVSMKRPIETLSTAL